MDNKTRVLAWTAATHTGRIKAFLWDGGTLKIERSETEWMESDELLVLSQHMVDTGEFLCVDMQTTTPLAVRRMMVKSRRIRKTSEHNPRVIFGAVE